MQNILLLQVRQLEGQLTQAPEDIMKPLLQVTHAVPDVQETHPEEQLKQFTEER